MTNEKKGKVYLIGAGPGDPKLITLRGLEAIQKADTVVYDRLANPALLKYMKEGAERIYVGKLPDRHTLRQEVINQLLADLALKGKTVARLKGGDPSVFGRVGEEAELLADNGVDFEIIPGITSAIAVPAYAGIPVTHRDLTSSLAIVTGHECKKLDDSNIDWAKLSTATGTIIFLMGVSSIAMIRDTLIANGKPSDTPAAVIRWGTRPEQRTLTGTLDDIVQKVESSGFTSPAIIIVGEVVKLRDKLAWYEKKPLFGRRILVTRSRAQASELADLIDEAGGEPVEFPVIQLREPTDPEKLANLDTAFSKLADYNWVFFTSVNGVEYFFRHLARTGQDIRALAGARLAAVGSATAQALRERGLAADILPGKFQAEDLLQAVDPYLRKGQKALLPRSEIARELLPAELGKRGLEVTEADVYESIPVGENAADLVRMLQENELHAITFTSSSTVRNLFTVLEKETGSREEALCLAAKLPAYCIGPVTAETARDFGFIRIVTAKEATISSLIDALSFSEDH
ncbi:uroporphyrinogen-III C-methyltransferase [Gorillibacterium massiliense]|uniref:uroporphyrinogen-III C-methyltransferase n=1 Tax=Gorillibacterium massiliense TaxID=1280390 RepID=UPI0004BB323F|nr:uroporphyrinogen-III C-methyltransferase [Gorillibacterium massiliense]